MSLTDLYTKLYDDAQQFTNRMLEKMKRDPRGHIDISIIGKNVNEELQELMVAKDLTQEIDALLDATYYIFQHLTEANYQIKEWIHPNFHTFDKFGVIYREPICREVRHYLQLALESTTEDSRAIFLMSAANYLWETVISVGVNPLPIWDLIHNVNLTKFGDDGYHNGVKWVKPSNIIPPDEDIRKEIARQLLQ